MSEENLSPAERYARSKKAASSPVTEFAGQLEFGLDDFQERACAALSENHGVLVAAPTGAGKTVVAEFAIYLAVKRGQKVFYTTPIKALSNQKYAELVARYGETKVGLLTGDTSNNPDAQILVMTTEVLRNMIYANSNSLINLGFVIMDEVHYLADRFRGAVWEEVILHLPKDVLVVSLSATVSNAEEFGAWLDEVRGNTSVIVSEHRPVPLNQHVLFGDDLIELFDATADVRRVNPELMQKHNNALRQPANRPSRGRRGHSNEWAKKQTRIPKISKPELIDTLQEAALLPAIFFIFSRAGCEGALSQCVRSGLRLTTAEERAKIREITESKCYSIADEDLITLGYHEWLDSLERGFAAHHAGMLPAFKEVVEELFLQKLVKVVFATETLALGINMPARTVVLDRLEKFNGEGQVQITSGEYTQLTGRAGRRGIDTEGHSVIQWSANMDPQVVAGLASKRTYPLISSFRPTYNMAVNLIDAFGRHRAREVLEMSFAQFQADRSVVGLARNLRDKEVALDGYRDAMKCDRGDFFDFASRRREITDLERELSSGGFRRDRARDIRSTRGRVDLEKRITQLKKELKGHPCQNCPDREDHSRWGERYFKLSREYENLRHQIESSTNRTAKTFDQICSMLVGLGYLEAAEEDFTVTDDGRKLARLFGDRDLLVAQCLRTGAWNSGDSADLAAVVASLVYEARRDDEDSDPKLPKGTFLELFENTLSQWDEIEYLAKSHKLRPTDEPNPALSLTFHRWARGASLQSVLTDSGLLPGDFIRWSKQVIDLLLQIAQVDDGKVSQKAKQAVDQIKRGIVAYSYFD